MRIIDVSLVGSTIERLFIEANFELPLEVSEAIKYAKQKELSATGREILGQIIANSKIASSERLPLCQDCGAPVVFVDIGQEVSLTGGDISDEITKGIGRAYTQNYLRPSIVTNPVERQISKDNPPPFIHFSIIPGDKIKISAMPKGGGCENMSYIAFLKPSDGIEGVKRFVLDSVSKSGADPCPPVILGICIGGNFETSALYAKRALLRKLGTENPVPRLASLEKEILDLVNKSGIGPLGLGGTTTALAVHIVEAPCHISSIPVAINTECHSHRYKEAEI